MEDAKNFIHYTLEQLYSERIEQRKQYAIALQTAISMSVLDEPVDAENKPLGYENRVLFDSGQPLYRVNKVNKLYRGIVRTGADEQGIKQCRHQAEQATLALNHLNKIIAYREEDEEPPHDLVFAKETPTLPPVFPRFISEDVIKVKVTMYKAHQSKRYDSNMVHVATYRPSSIVAKKDATEQDKKRVDQLHREEYKQFLNLYEALANEGYEPMIDDEDYQHHLYVDVALLLERYQCISIQRRAETGKQVRAEFYKLDDKGLLKKLKRESVGVLLIPHDQEVEVYESDSRRTRNDNLYLDDNPSEIKDITTQSEFSVCRLYRNFDS